MFTISKFPEKFWVLLTLKQLASALQSEVLGFRFLPYFVMDEPFFVTSAVTCFHISSLCVVSIVLTQ